MVISVNYKKRKNSNLFNKFQTNKNIDISNVQNYIPIYNRFFSLNQTNWNSINLNHSWALSDIKDSKHANVFTGKTKHISDDEDMTNTQQVFIKMAPLLDPFKYLVGNYNYNNSQLFNLPTINKDVRVHPKMEDTNNSSYVDGFFSFLSSQLLNEHQFIHGLDYYGSFLAIKNNYTINVIDDLDYLVHSEFFNKHKGKLFDIEDYSHIIVDGRPKPLQPLTISSLKSNLSIQSIDNDMFENIFDDAPTKSSIVTLDDIKQADIDLVELGNSDLFELGSQKAETLKGGSDCSSRTSHTNENELENSDLEDENIEEDEHVVDDNVEDENAVDDDDNYEDMSDTTYNSTYETIMLTFPKFPVQVICMENCKNTFDYLIDNGELSDEDWFSALMQIIMILITYQKLFSFTHNDLHTCNIMYIPTSKNYIFYTYKKQTYKVPTFGRIYKLIDFGRAIYKFNGKIFCSDSFKNGGDAASQYNCEPYFNDNKPRLEPNFSFDLCRLACSIFDYVVDDFDMIKNISSPQNKCSPLVKLIVDWCIDDNGINVLYKNNGTERYPEFKLYKMIARCVHKHTPQAQLERPEFNKYLVPNKRILKNEICINIDELPTYAN
jgi:hypothetical protein